MPSFRKFGKKYLVTSFGEQKRWNIEQMEEFYGVYERARLGPRTGNKTKQVLKNHGIFFFFKDTTERKGFALNAMSLAMEVCSKHAQEILHFDFS